MRGDEITARAATCGSDHASPHPAPDTVQVHLTSRNQARFFKNEIIGWLDSRLWFNLWHPVSALLILTELNIDSIWTVMANTLASIYFIHCSKSYFQHWHCSLAVTNYNTTFWNLYLESTKILSLIVSLRRKFCPKFASIQYPTSKWRHTDAPGGLHTDTRPQHGGTADKQWSRWENGTDAW